MKCRNSGSSLIIEDSPGPYWFLGLFFLSVGLVFVYGSLGGYSNYQEASLLAIRLHFIGGAIAVSVGGWLLFTPATKLLISPTTKTLSISRKGVFSKEEHTLHFAGIQRLEAIEEKDSDGDPIWKIVIRDQYGEFIEFSSLLSHDGEGTAEVISKANLILNEAH